MKTDLSQLSTLRFEAGDGVATVTINRPDRYNSFTAQMCTEFQEVWNRVRGDDQIRAVILTAAGDKAFCTGVDRDEIPSEESGIEFDFDPYTYRDPGEVLGPRANECWKPVIAAVNGMACGGAFYLLGEADIIVAAEHATFFDPHVTYGMAAIFEPIQMLAKMPFGEVLRMSLMASYERISAARALAIGLVTEVVPADELQLAARRIASGIAAQPARSVQATLRTLWMAREVSRAQALSMGNTFLNLGNSAEALEQGQQAFRGGRVAPHVR
jgi:enoyl-CoA hydratase/carnithine racemase